MDHIIATNPTGSIEVIRSALPQLCARGGGRIIQIPSYGGQVALAGNSPYRAAGWGVESVDVEPAASTDLRAGE